MHSQQLLQLITVHFTDDEADRNFDDNYIIFHILILKKAAEKLLMYFTHALSLLLVYVATHFKSNWPSFYKHPTSATISWTKKSTKPDLIKPK